MASPAPTNVIAHRGANRRARENTLEAFQAAVALGSDGIELDVRRTVDAALVIHHDAQLPDGRVIRESRRDELPDWLPELHSALDACAPAMVNIEIKNSEGDPDFDPDRSIADRVVEALRGRSEPNDRWLISRRWTGSASSPVPAPRC
ncbi:MAG: glycerophosphodiester phosphodiesterase [Ilumatobacteraceae bacterium]